MGTYVLLLYLDGKNKIAETASIMNITFKPGYFVYVGESDKKWKAVEEHIERSIECPKINQEKKIDYLLSLESTSIESIFFSPDDFSCELSDKLSNSEPRRFGQHSCSCRNHLSYYKRREDGVNDISNSIHRLGRTYIQSKYPQTLDFSSLF